MKRMLLLLGLLIFGAGPASAAVPSIRDLGVNAEALAPLIGESQLILLHEPRRFTWTADGETYTKKAQFISSLQVIAAPPDAVRKVVAAVSDYPKFMAEMEEVVERTEGGRRLVDVESEHNAIVLSVGVDYTIAVTEETSGDITWNLVEGDLDGLAARWEFFPLPGGRTLLAFTSWQDFESISFTVRTIMRAQPDFRTVIPVASAAVMMTSVARRASGLPSDPRKAVKEMQKTPRIPLLSTSGSAESVAAMRRLAEVGTFMLIHPVQWLEGKKGKPQEFLFMSAGAITPFPVDRLKTLTTAYERIPEYLPNQVDSVKRVAGEGGEYDFKLKIGISILTVGVRYRLAFEEQSPVAITFHNVAGDMEHIYGAREFFDLGDGKSLFFYTTGSVMGEDAPAILKVGQDAPNRDLIIGISSTALFMQKLLPWLEKQ